MAPTNDPLGELPLGHRLLLRLLPSHVRDEHGRELRDDLAEGRQSTTALAIDILRASPAAHWDVLRQDLTLAVRQMRRAPAFAIIACLTLAVGIGGNVAFFTLVDGVLLRQLPVAGADRIVDITEEHLGRNLRSFGISPANYRDVVRDTSIFQAAAIFSGRSGTLRLGENRQRVSYTAVSGDFFRVFTEAPIMGRVLRPEDDVPGASAILLSFEFWQRALGGDPGIVGKRIDIDGDQLYVVGVMSPNFLSRRGTTAFWRPVGFSDAEWGNRGARSVQAVARLAPGVTVARAGAVGAATGRALASQNPKTNDGWSILVRELRMARVSGVRTPLLFVWAAGALVLLIAIANVASLFLTRAVEREREVALRSALGARTGRVVRQLVTEGLLLAGVSAVAGLGLADLLLSVVRPIASNFVPRMDEVAVGPRAIAYTVLVALLTTVLLTLVAASPARGTSVWHALGTGRSSTTRGRRRLQRSIVVGEVALAVFVLIASALVVRTLVGVLRQAMGFDSHGVLTFRTEPPWRVNLQAPMDSLLPALMRDRDRAVEGYDALLRQLAVLPGVRGAGAINRLPLTGSWWMSGVRLADHPETSEAERITSFTRPITADYFEAMGTRVLRGRGLERTDAAGGGKVVVVDAEFARRAWGNADPLGRELLFDGPPNHAPPRAKVVGVVETIHMDQLDAELRPTIYVPFSQAIEGHYLDWGMDVVVRGATLALEPEIRRIVRSVFPDAAVFEVATMDDVVRVSTANRRFQLMVLAFFGVLALVLTTIGVGGTLLLSVRERRRELAVRVALGARPGQLWWRVQRDGVVLAGAGALLGAGGTVAGAGAFASLTYGVSVRDPLSLAAGPILVLVAAFLAAAVPATRAVRVSPIAVLRDS
ncbi:MAG TPA: ADOP family duplicated permease [Gemmatimonadaceae bacterium]|nr:ADOP family duplicated permease [Gemmatimonadaceae bacterium]